MLLVDNGSLRAESTWQLRTLAEEVSVRLGWPVEAVSLLHSAKVPEGLLGGRAARSLEGTLRERAEAGQTRFLLLPLFFGPSGAVVDYIPERVRALQREFPGLEARVAPCLVDAGAREDRRVAVMLADGVRVVIRREGLLRPPVVLVDHGTPARAVNAVRNVLAVQLGEVLGEACAGVWPASMERREGAEFDFNEPLLERAFEGPALREGTVVLAMQFLSPGKHAGPEGDVARICAGVMARHPGLRIVQTQLLGAHPALPDLLAERCREGLRDAGWRLGA